MDEDRQNPEIPPRSLYVKGDFKDRALMPPPPTRTPLPKVPLTRDEASEYLRITREEYAAQRRYQLLRDAAHPLPSPSKKPITKAKKRCKSPLVAKLPKKQAGPILTEADVLHQNYIPIVNNGIPRVPTPWPPQITSEQPYLNSTFSPTYPNDFNSQMVNSSYDFNLQNLQNPEYQTQQTGTSTSFDHNLLDARNQNRSTSDNLPIASNILNYVEKIPASKAIDYSFPEQELPLAKSDDIRPNQLYQNLNASPKIEQYRNISKLTKPIKPPGNYQTLESDVRSYKEWLLENLNCYTKKAKTSKAKPSTIVRPVGENAIVQPRKSIDATATAKGNKSFANLQSMREKEKLMNTPVMLKIPIVRPGSSTMQNVKFGTSTIGENLEPSSSTMRKKRIVQADALKMLQTNTAHTSTSTTQENLTKQTNTLKMLQPNTSNMQECTATMQEKQFMQTVTYHDLSTPMMQEYPNTSNLMMQGNTLKTYDDPMLPPSTYTLQECSSTSTTQQNLMMHENTLKMYDDPMLHASTSTLQEYSSTLTMQEKLIMQANTLKMYNDPMLQPCASMMQEYPSTSTMQEELIMQENTLKVYNDPMLQPSTSMQLYPTTSTTHNSLDQPSTSTMHYNSSEYNLGRQPSMASVQYNLLQQPSTSTMLYSINQPSTSRMQYDSIHQPSTSRMQYDSIHQPSTSTMQHHPIQYNSMNNSMQQNLLFDCPSTSYDNGNELYEDSGPFCYNSNGEYIPDVINNQEMQAVPHYSQIDETLDQSANQQFSPSEYFDDDPDPPTNREVAQPESFIDDVDLSSDSDDDREKKEKPLIYITENNNTPLMRKFLRDAKVKADIYTTDNDTLIWKDGNFSFARKLRPLQEVLSENLDILERHGSRLRRILIPYMPSLKKP